MTEPSNRTPTDVDIRTFTMVVRATSIAEATTRAAALLTSPIVEVVDVDAELQVAGTYVVSATLRTIGKRAVHTDGDVADTGR